MQVIPIKTELFKEGYPIIDFIVRHVESLEERDILVITSKIVALAEGRVVPLANKESAILKESKKSIQTQWAILTLMQDGWGIGAGADESNANKKLILLPKNPFRTAAQLRQQIRIKKRIKNLGIIITDTRSIPLRVGTIGRALSFSGFQPLKNYIGKRDLFGRKNRITISNRADALAGAAVAVMGEGDEQTPLAIIKGAPVIFTSKLLSKKVCNLALSPEQDIFSQVFTMPENEFHIHSKKR